MTQSSIEWKIGQLFIIGFQGDRVSPGSTILTDIEKRNLGGVILFDRHLASSSKTNNIINEQQLLQLTTDLQQAAPTPLLIGVDQEGGQVKRLRKESGFVETPSARKLGDIHNTDITRKSAEQIAKMLNSVGVNLNFAPVVDLNVNVNNPIIGKYDRSFSSNPAKVALHCKVWVKAHKGYNILSSLKHFPGHGSSIADSHQGFVDITDSWRKTEIAPYRELIREGLGESVMVGHLFHQHLDNTYPATLSRRIVTELLREELGFEGVTISDDMQMRAITERYGLEDACCRAIAAGIDMLVIGNNLVHDQDVLTKVKSAILKAIDNGTISEQRIDEAWLRIQDLKQMIGE